MAEAHGTKEHLEAIVTFDSPCSLSSFFELILGVNVDLEKPKLVVRQVK